MLAQALIFWLVVASADGGFYLRAFDVPAFCPLTAFCLPWNPAVSNGFDAIKIIQVGGLKVEIGQDFHFR